MKCPSCKTELPDNAKYCTYCGMSIEKQALSSDDVVKPSTNLGDKIKEMVVDFWKKLSLSGKISIVAISVFLLLLLVAILAKNFLSASIAFISLALIIVALLIKKNIIKTQKKWLYIVAMTLAIILIVPYFNSFGTEYQNPDIDLGIENTPTSTPGYTIDYYNAADFEQALNDGAKAKGKIVQFDVIEYKPNSALGINCWSGEHLNFISKEELKISKGSIVIGQITEEPTKSFGSWIIPYEVLSIDKEFVKNNGKTEDNNPSKKPDSTENLTPTTATTPIVTLTSTIAPTPTHSPIPTPAPTPTPTEKPRSVFYSTNDTETAKKGNTGVFSYKNKKGAYDIYWIIDFDAGYIYFFTDGNGEDYCDKLKIISGDLNDRITITWNYDGIKTNWYLHFKYTNNPATLIVNDHFGSATEFTTTNLEDALNVRNTKTIINH